MKHLLFAIIFFISSFNSFSQNYYVEETERGFHLPLLEKLLELNKETVKSKDKSKYTIRCIFTKGGGYGRAAKGYIVILDSRNDKKLLQSKQEKGMRNAFKGMQNPNTLLIKRIAKKQLEKLLIQLQDIKLQTDEEILKENPKSTPQASDELYVKLKNLKRLLDEGIITQNEFDIQKKKILENE